LLQQLSAAGSGKGHSVYDELDAAIWTMRGTIDAYHQGVLRLADPTNPDGQAIAPEMEAVAALAAPLRVLDAAQNTASTHLSVQGGGGQQ